MNKRNLLGHLVWLVAFLIPLQPAILSTEDVSNSTGLISFVALVALVFLGYFLVEGSRAQKRSEAEESH